MSEKIKFIELNYHYHREFMSPAEAISLHMPSNLFAQAMLDRADVKLVKHINYEGQLTCDGIHYRFFRGKNKFFHIPYATHRYLKEEDPDMVLVQGLIFPFQVIMLRRKLGLKCKIVLQHQGEVPFKKKKIFQRIADRYVDGYFFTSFGNAEEWISAGIIHDRAKCFEIDHSSSVFARRDKVLCRGKTGISGELNFLWVGRLNENKDPFTVLKGFEKYFDGHSTANLYMIYGEDQELEQVKRLVDSSPVLRKHVHLIGKVPHHELEYWYNAADYLVSGSHREGGCYALSEAMACGCIPIVTEIPSAMKKIGNGEFGYHYQPGDTTGLHNVLSGLDSANQKSMSAAVERHFREQMSAEAIAGKILDVYDALKSVVK